MASWWRRPTDQLPAIHLNDSALLFLEDAARLYGVRPADLIIEAGHRVLNFPKQADGWMASLAVFADSRRGIDRDPVLDESLQGIARALSARSTWYSARRDVRSARDGRSLEGYVTQAENRLRALGSPPLVGSATRQGDLQDTDVQKRILGLARLAYMELPDPIWPHDPLFPMAVNAITAALSDGKEELLMRVNHWLPPVDELARHNGPSGRIVGDSDLGRAYIAYRNEAILSAAHGEPTAKLIGVNNALTALAVDDGLTKEGMRL